MIESNTSEGPVFALPASNLVNRPEAARLCELGEDLAAVWSNSQQAMDGWMTRPSILRRVASAFAARIGAETDRIVGLGPGSLLLGGSVSLSTGLPFCAVLESGSVFGSFYAGESVVVISADGTGIEPGWLGNLEVSGRLCILPGEGKSNGYEPLLSQLPRRSGSQVPQFELNSND